MKEISKTRRIIGWILSILPTGMIVFSGINKLLSHPVMVESLNKINLGALEKQRTLFIDHDCDPVLL